MKTICIKTGESGWKPFKEREKRELKETAESLYPSLKAVIQSMRVCTFLYRLLEQLMARSFMLYD